MFIATSLLLLSGEGLWARSMISVRINEAVLKNVANYQDNYGNHNTWIELYNSSDGTVDIKGCFLTNDFWADSSPMYGTFHTNFNLSYDRSAFIAFVDNDGKTIIDSITLPAQQIPVDYSYARIVRIGSHSSCHITAHTTPNTNNFNEKIDRLKKMTAMVSL